MIVMKITLMGSSPLKYLSHLISATEIGNSEKFTSNGTLE